MVNGKRKRDKMQVFIDMLTFIQKNNHFGTKISTLTLKTNISYNMVLEYSNLFIRNGLIKKEEDRRLFITGKGNEFLGLVSKIGGYLNK